jgi:hypothetical protein
MSRRELYCMCGWNYQLYSEHSLIQLNKEKFLETSESGVGTVTCCDKCADRDTSESCLMG